MAARVSGKLKSAFPDGAPNPLKANKPAQMKVQTRAPALAEAKDDVNMIVADADFMADRFWVQVQNLGTHSAHQRQRFAGQLTRQFDRLQ